MGVVVGMWVLLNCAVELLILFCPGRLPLFFFGWTLPVCLLLNGNHFTDLEEDTTVSSKDYTR